mgnify:FL=1
MKILISSDGIHAHYFQRLSWLRAFNAIGIKAQFWDCKSLSAFDAFDLFEPDIFLGQVYNLTTDLVKCIYERPHLKVGLRSGDWGDFQQDRRFNVLYATQEQLELLKKLKDETGQPEFVHIHYDEEAVNQTHSNYSRLGIKAKSLIMCGDVEEYLGGSYDESLSCDIGFVGGYWPYKGLVIDQFLTPLCYPVSNYNIKVFGNQPWNINQYCGVIQDERVRDLFVSAKVCPNLSEPHAHEYGFDINERCFKISCAGGFCISDNITSIAKIFKGNGIVFAEDPEDFKDKIDYYIKNEEERLTLAKQSQQFLLDNHTNFHRVSQILQYFGYEEESEKTLLGWQNTRRQINA